MGVVVVGVRTRWRPGVDRWLFGAALVVTAAGLVQHDVARLPVWWWLAVHAVGVAGLVTLALQGLVWRVTATAEGLRVRTGRTVRMLRWDEAAGARFSSEGLVIVGLSPARSVVVDHAGFWSPRRGAREIAAMIADPALRPSVR